MFCPNCGKGDQTPETYCRQCGIFLPDISRPVKSGQTPQDHVTANIVLNSMTIVACFTLAALLYSILGFQDSTHPLIYVTAGLLIAMGFWHTQTLWRSILLRRHFKMAAPKNPGQLENHASPAFELDGAKFKELVPASITDRTTRNIAISERVDLSKSER